MQTKLGWIFFFLFPCFAFGQTGKNKYIGFDILQVPATTLNINYSIEIQPFITPVFDLGYTINYAKNFDFIGDLLTLHCDCGNNGYELDIISGGYIQLGGLFNFRNNFEKHNYFHIGIFLTNSLVYENGYSIPPIGETLPPQQPTIPVSHTVFVAGLNFMGGYEFSLSERWKSVIDFQVSLPGKSQNNLYGYRNYIPGMGYRNVEKPWFPRLICNLKYRL
jgi:hypothetical protein